MQSVDSNPNLNQPKRKMDEHINPLDPDFTSKDPTTTFNPSNAEDLEETQNLDLVTK